MLRVVEIFESIQGESTFAGLPCGFVRLAGCNLRCRYCDTGYARSGGVDMSIGDIARALGALGHRVVEVTGGEPLIQTETPQLIRALVSEFDHVLVETNGSQDISPLPRGAVRILDIKTPGSGHSDSVMWSNLDHLTPDDEVKFVLTSRADYEWACASMARVAGSGVGTILLSPVPGMLDPSDLARWMLADRLPARLQLQLHKIIRCR